MTTWLIEYQSPQGIRVAQINAATKEQAGMQFIVYLQAAGLPCSILSINPQP